MPHDLGGLMLPAVLLPDTNTTWSILAVVAVAAVGGAVAWWRRGKPARDRDEAVRDAILGKAAVLDRAGGVIEKKQPGLVDRTSTLEQAVKLLVDQSSRLTRVEDRVDKLEIADEARREVRRESTAMWQAVANKDVIDVDPEEP